MFRDMRKYLVENRFVWCSTSDVSCYVLSANNIVRDVWSGHEKSIYQFYSVFNLTSVKLEDVSCEMLAFIFLRRRCQYFSISGSLVRNADFEVSAYFVEFLSFLWLRAIISRGSRGALYHFLGFKSICTHDRRSRKVAVLIEEIGHNHCLFKDPRWNYPGHPMWPFCSYNLWYTTK